MILNESVRVNVRDIEAGCDAECSQPNCAEDLFIPELRA